METSRAEGGCVELFNRWRVEGWGGTEDEWEEGYETLRMYQNVNHSSVRNGVHVQDVRREGRPYRNPRPETHLGPSPPVVPSVTSSVRTSRWSQSDTLWFPSRRIRVF